MIWFEYEDVVRIHSLIIQSSGGEDGLRDKSVLLSAISAPLQTFGGVELFSGDLEKIARLGFGIASNHAFVDGNKRIGAMMVQLLLKWNGYKLQIKDGELSDMFIAIANGSASENDLLLWIVEHIEAHNG